MLRPQFLIAGIALNLLGAAVALYLGATMDWAKFSVFQIVVASSQLAGACANEVADVASDGLNMNRTWFSGGSGMIVTGRIRAETVIRLMMFWTALSLIASFVLAFLMKAGVAAFALMVIGISMALSYSLRPLMLSYKGFGEFAMAFMVSFLTPVVSFYVIYGTFRELIVWTTIPLVLQLIALMMVVERPDFEADLAAGKKTLVIRLGPTPSWNVGVILLALAAAVALSGGLTSLPTTTALISGAVLLIEALTFWILGSVPESRLKYFWSTAVTCAFYVFVILLITVTIRFAR